ncbi:hypothetical protein [Candidatus Halobonum tyrrellensis]|uniref:DUF4352 domain-containing protein n=1 Tax=Candidatus Halobonum tyrrellensis G22 TaxID=1324957 RepID=V4HBL6_9EURY|nr:hypothetical protein [Candidatus Halobonum tyrrellensis]ESP87438.1 hypothetical protein K933_14223 [Candidatus Halobonum tyrrellensis G22]
MNRRTFLSTTGTLAAAGLAGCSGDSGDNKLLGQPTKTVSSPQGVEPQHRSFGETVEFPRVSLTVSDPRMMKTYEWSENGEAKTADAGEGNQWAMAHVRAENIADREARLPLTLDFKGVVGERVFHPGRNKSPTAKYIGGKADPGVVSEGDMGFLVPESASVDQFRVLYEERRTDGKHAVWWEP